MSNNSIIRAAKPRSSRGRLSLNKTPLAVLRQITGEHVSSFARILGISIDYLQKLESNQRSLTEELAARIHKATGISVSWLLGNAKHRAVDDMGLPYSRERYVRRRAILEGKRSSSSSRGALRGLWGAKIDAVMASAQREHDESLFIYGVNRFLADAVAQFGSDEQVEREGETDALALKPLKEIFSEGRHPKTGHPIKGSYAFPEYQECRDAFILMLKKLRKNARKPIAPGRPHSGPSILPILEAVAVLMGVEKLDWPIEKTGDMD